MRPLGAFWILSSWAIRSGCLPSSVVFRLRSGRDKQLLRLVETISSPLGIGFPYYAVLPADLYRPDMAAFVEVTPETICLAAGDWKNDRDRNSA